MGEVDEQRRGELAELIRELAVVRGRVTLSSGKEADYYVDLRRATLHHAAAPLIGVLLRQLTADWDYAAVGGLTLGADPVGAAVLHAPGPGLDGSGPGGGGTGRAVGRGRRQGRVPTGDAGESQREHGRASPSPDTDRTFRSIRISLPGREP